MLSQHTAAASLLPLALLLPSTTAAQLDPTPQPIFPDLSFGTPLDIDEDGQSELIGVSRASGDLVAYEFDGDGRPVLERTLASLGATGLDRSELRAELGDLDGDGRNDLLIFDGSSLATLVGQSDGTFSAPVQIASVTPVEDAALTDLDSDGDLDALVYPFIPNSSITTTLLPIRFVENMGGGVFAAPVALNTVPNGFRGLQSADLDGDGDLDFIGLQADPRVPLVIRNQNGTLVNEALPGAQGNVRNFEIGDVNGDGALDVLVQRFGPGAAQTAAVDLFAGGPGGFQAPVTVLEGSDLFFNDLELADIDGSGVAELVIRVRPTSTPTEPVILRIYRWSAASGYGNPFDAFVVPDDTTLLFTIEAGDLSGDGRDDLVIRLSVDGLPFDMASSHVLLGDVSAGAPALIETAPLLVRHDSDPMTGDLDGDGVIDLIDERNGQLRWLRGIAGSVSFELPVFIADATEIEAVADLNGDGLPEIIAFKETAPDTYDLLLVQSLGGGAFAAPVTIANLGGPTVLELRPFDLDRDGDLDLIPGPSSLLKLWIENLEGLSFAQATSTGLPPLSQDARSFAGDFNDDGVADFIEREFSAFFPGPLSWFEGLGGGNFAPRELLQITEDGTTRTLDVNEDGVDDVVYGSGGDTFVLTGGPAGPAAATPVQILGGLFFGERVRLIDVDNDGRTDLVGEPLPMPVVAQLAFLRTGPLSFDPVAIEIAPIDVRLIDFGGDGDLDGLGKLLSGSPIFPIDVAFENDRRALSGTPFCGPAVPNSSGGSASLIALGTPEVQANELRLRVDDAPIGRFGFFLASQTRQAAAPVVASDGLLCLAGQIGRYVGPGQVQSTGATGTLQLDLDVTSIPTPVGPITATPGATWFFQAWVRDAGPAGSTSNFSDGVMVVFE